MWVRWGNSVGVIIERKAGAVLVHAVDPETGETQGAIDIDPKTKQPIIQCNVLVPDEKVTVAPYGDIPEPRRPSREQAIAMGYL